MYHSFVSNVHVKVVQLATGHVGGAGLAARRLHQQLLYDGYDCDFYTLEKSNFVPSTNEYSIKRSYIRQLLSKFAIFFNEKLTHQIHFSVLSTNAASLDFFRKLSYNKTRVLHFHNWQNLISQKSLLKLISEGFPIVLTLHDERIATGGCHYQLSCTQNKSGCRSCPRASQLLYPQIRWNRQSLSLTLTGHPTNLVFVSPSEWLKNSVMDSLDIDATEIHKVFNPLGPLWNIEKFDHRLREKSKEKTRVGVATMSDSFVKHGELLRALAIDKAFMQDYEICYLRDYPEPESKLSEFWKEIDVLLALSRADNSPNSIVEARSLGIPVLTSNIGGIPELLGDFDIALESNEHNIEDIIIKLSQIKEKDKSKCDLNFTHDINSSEKFVELYKSLLKNS
jgi:glycosyltransferase involved in cell wall biosynthesis